MKKWIVIIFIFISSVSYTQVKSPNNQELLLQRLVGIWDVYFLSNPDPLLGTFSVNSIAKNHAVFSVFQIISNNDVTYEADAIWCYDNKIEKVFAYEANSQGQVLVHFGSFESNSSLYLIRTTKGENPKRIQESLLTWHETNQLTFSITFFTKNRKMNIDYLFIKRKL